MKASKWFWRGMQAVATGVALFLAYWPMAYVSLDDDYWAPLISLHPIWRHINDVFLFYWVGLFLVLLLVLWALHVGRYQLAPVQRWIAIGGAALLALTVAFEPNEYFDGFRSIIERIRFQWGTGISVVLICVELLLIFSLLTTFGGWPKRRPVDNDEPLSPKQWLIIRAGLIGFFLLGPVMACFMPIREDSSSSPHIFISAILSTVFTSIALIFYKIGERHFKRASCWTISLLAIATMCVLPILLTYLFKIFSCYSPAGLTSAIGLTVALVIARQYHPRLKNINLWILGLCILVIFIASFYIDPVPIRER